MSTAVNIFRFFQELFPTHPENWWLRCAFSIFLYPWINKLCSYETGRQVLLHFTDGNHKAERLNVLNVSKEELWTRANIQIVLVYVLSTRTHCILSYSVAVLLTTSYTGTSLPIKYKGWEGEKVQCCWYEQPWQNGHMKWKPQTETCCHWTNCRHQWNKRSQSFNSIK